MDRQSKNQSPLHRYLRLSASFRGLLQLLALTGGLSRSLLPDLIRQAGIPAPRGRNWLGTDLRAAEHALLQLDLIDARGRCCRELEHRLALEAAPLAGAALDAARRGGPAHLPLRLRLALYARDGRAYREARSAWLEAFPRTVEAAGPLDGQFIGLAAVSPDETPFARWFAELSPEMALDVLSSNLERLFETGETPPGLADMLRRLPALRGDVQDSRILLLDILSGRFPEAGAQMAGLPDDFRRPLYGGLIAFFDGRDAEAVKLLREAQKRWRKLTGRRRLPLPGPGGLCLVLAMLRAEDPALNDELIGLVDNLLAQRLPVHKGVLAAHALFQMMQGRESVARGLLLRAIDLPRRDPLAEAVFYAVDRQLNHVSRPEAEALATAYRNVMPLVADILDEALGRPVARSVRSGAGRGESASGKTAGTSGTGETGEAPGGSGEGAGLPGVAAPGGSGDGPASGSDAGRGSGSVSESGTAGGPPGTGETAGAGGTGPGVRFGAFLERRESWERLFDNLERQLTRPVIPARRKRLIWLLDPETFRVEAVEQSARTDRRGEVVWTPGRIMSLKRLVEQSVGMDWLTEQDRRVLATAESERDWSGTRYFFKLSRTIEALVGHPLLFRAGDRRPLTLKGRQVELVVSRNEEDGSCLLALSRPLGKGQVQLVETGSDTFTFFTLPEALEPAAELLRDGLRVPPEGAPRVLALLRDLDPSIPVRPELAAEEVPARPDPVVRLRPQGKGLEVSLLVRPFGMAGTPVCAPGEGTPELLAEVDGRTLRVRRDFDAEIRAARDFVRSCPTLRGEGGIGPWLLDDLETALQCLMEIQAAPGAPETEWPEGETLRVQAAGPSVRFRAEAQHSREWFSLRGELTVNEELVLRMTDLLERLDKAEGRFVPLGDGGFLALTDAFRRQLERLRRLSEPAGRGEPEDSRRVHPLAVGAVQDLFDAAEGSMDADESWRELAARFRSAERAVPEVSPLLRAELRDYQFDGFAWMIRLARWGAGACLADDMGLGKTVQTIAVLLELTREGPALIVAPTSVCYNWENEIARFAPTLRTHRLGGAGDRRAELVETLGAGDVLVASYGLLHAEADVLASRQWRMAVFDEAQALKNADTKRARAGRRIRAGFRLVLTGTPIENYLEDLWSLFNIINPGLLGTRQSFQKRFSCLNGVPAKAGEGSETGRGAARQALRALVRPFILRRTKSEVLAELPPRTEQVIRVDMPDEERAFYEALRRRSLDVLDRTKDREESEGARKLSILTELTRLRRACCHPALVDPETKLPGAKLAAFMELVEELERGGHRALVFSQFVGHLAQIRRALDAAGIRYRYLDGSTPERERRRGVEAFQNGDGLLFLISLKAGGQGLNLTAADYVIHLDPWWNPAVEDQASDRAHRLGQERPVTVYRLVVRDSVEEKILGLHRSKRALAADFLEGASVPLSEAELLALFR